MERGLGKIVLTAGGKRGVKPGGKVAVDDGGDCICCDDCPCGCQCNYRVTICDDTVVDVIPSGDYAWIGTSAGGWTASITYDPAGACGSNLVLEIRWPGTGPDDPADLVFTGACGGRDTCCPENATWTYDADSSVEYDCWPCGVVYDHLPYNAGDCCVRAGDTIHAWRYEEQLRWGNYTGNCQEGTLRGSYYHEESIDMIYNGDSWEASASSYRWSGSWDAFDCELDESIFSESYSAVGAVESDGLYGHYVSVRTYGGPGFNVVIRAHAHNHDDAHRCYQGSWSEPCGTVTSYWEYWFDLPTHFPDECAPCHWYASDTLCDGQVIGNKVGVSWFEDASIDFNVSVLNTTDPTATVEALP